MEKIVSQFWNSEPLKNNIELECRIGYVQNLTYVDYQNMMKKFKSLGFTHDDEKTFLRIVPMKENQVPLSVRMQINDDTVINNYLSKKETILEILRNHPQSCFCEKKEYHRDASFNPIKPSFFPDYNFKVSITEETKVANELFIESFKKNDDRIFRLIKRISFRRKDYPFIIDFSIVFSNTGPTFVKPEEASFEVEIEVNNQEIGDSTMEKILFQFRKLIAYGLKGLQETNYHISISEQQRVLSQYYELVQEDRFIGPTVKTLQLENLEELQTKKNAYCSTEKADGERHLMFIAPNTGRIYMIQQKLKIIFTGCKTLKEKYFNSVFDGELILHNKEGLFVNMFAIFDAYFMDKKDLRKMPFTKRYKFLSDCMANVDIHSVIQDEDSGALTPMIFLAKTFRCVGVDDNKTIFDCNRQVLEIEYLYEIDGIILTPLDEPVSNNTTLKWKFPEKNTIDFLIKHLQDTVYVLKCGYTKSQLSLCPKEFILNGAEDMKLFDSSAYVSKKFVPTLPYDENVSIVEFENCQTEDGDEFVSGDIVEFAYLKKQWIPLRIRRDKQLIKDESFGNNFVTANNNWKSIHFPIDLDMIKTGILPETIVPIEDVYYQKTNISTQSTNGLREFHNAVKRKMLSSITPRETLIDFCCGKAGDLHKWLHLKIKHVFGIDTTRDNIVNAQDGCYARYLSQCYYFDPAKKEMKKKKQFNTTCLFVQGDLAKNLLEGDATFLKEDYEIVRKEKMPYDICSCQFAIHYFFKDLNSIQGFLHNVVTVVKIGGHFAGCCFDGEKVFEKLKGRKEINCNDSDGNRIWCLRKGYKEASSFPEGEDSLGMKITVFQESINAFIDEYLVNFDYLCELMEMIGFFLVKDEMFESCYEESFEMSEVEREISFLNRSFVFQKKTKVSSV